MSKVFKSIGNAVTSVVKGVVKAVGSVVKAVVNVVASVVNFVAQPFMGMLGGTPDIPTAAAEEQRQQGVLIQREGSNQNIPVVYGYRKVGGIVTFAETGSTNNKYLYVAYVFSEGIVEGLREVFIDDWQLPVNLVGNLNASQVVDITTDRYANRVRLQWYPGAYFADANSSTVGATVKSGIFAEAPSFTNKMNYNGLAVLFARFEWKEIKTQADADTNPFSGNIPNVQISMLGRRVASLLTTTESTTYDGAPVRYSTNPAEILLDYLRNPRYGKGLLNDDIHWDTWKRAARKCNTTVTYLSTNADITGPIMTCNYVLDTSASIMSNVKTLLMGFRAYMPYVQGKYKLRIEDAGNETDILSGSAVIAMTAIAQPFLKSSYTGNVCDIVGNITYTGIEKSAKYNVVAVSYVDPDQKFSVQSVIYPETETERQIYIDRDGGRENKLDAAFPTLTNYAMAKDMARLLFNKSRRQETCSLTISSEGLELEPGDSIRIQSNVLNFGTDPWRIISLKVNDDMTVDIGCVRNPDDIYPYARVGEEDIVLAVYVPKGSIIYYPGSSNTPLLGLVPPTHAVYPVVPAPVTPTNPGPTNPNAPGGGGVGGGNPPGGDTGGTTPNTPGNNPAVPVPPPPPFAAVLALKSSSATKVGTTNFLINLVFTQPQDGLYSYAILWWRYNRFSPWVEVRIDTKPGAGGEIPITFGPSLPPGDYTFYARAYATDGRASINVTQGQASVRANSAELNPNLVGIATASTQQVAEGWTLPSSEVPTTPRYDDNIAVINISTKLSSGAPYANRKLSVTLQQITDVFATPINPLIDGITIYYKQKDDAYWAYENFKFVNIGQYFPGQEISFDLAGDFGSRVYPSDIIPNTINSTLQKYDFVARLTYADGKPAERQFGPVQGLVELNGLGQYSFKVVGTDPYATGVSRSAAIPAGFNSTFLTVDQDPNKTSPSGSELVPGINRIIPNRFENKLTFVFNPPTTSLTKFRGYKIRYREVVPGTNPDFREVDVPGVAGIDGKITYTLFENGFRLNQKYEWVISVQVNSIGTIVDATNCLYARYAVPSNLFEDNIYINFGWTIKDTKEALGQLKSTFPLLPTINPKSWIKKQVLPYDPYQSSVFLNAHLTKVAGGFPLNIYLKFRFQAPGTGASHLICYRRIYDISGVGRNTVGNSAKYFGLGPWEKVRVALSDLTTDGEGFKTINLRGPLDWEYFNARYQVANEPNNANLVDVKFGASGKFPFGYATDPSGYYPLGRYGVGNKETTTRTMQYLFVLEDTGTESTKGLLLTDFFTPQQAGLEYAAEVDGFISKYGAVPKDNVIDNTAIFNSLDAGFGRNLSEAITAPALNRLWMAGTSLYSGSPPDAVSGSTSFNSFIQNPSNGDVIY
jgi:hypothetical protein